MEIFLEKITVCKKYNSIGKVNISRLIISSEGTADYQEEIISKTNVAILIPYSIYGGGEIYIKELISSNIYENFNFHLIYCKPNKLEKNLVMPNVIHHSNIKIDKIDYFFKKNRISCCIFYNSIDIYKKLKIAQLNYSFKLIEIYHSDFTWSDSMALVKNHDVDCLIKVDENVGKNIVTNRVEICRVPIDFEKFSPNNGDFAKKTFKLGSFNNIGVISRISKEKT